MRPCCVDKRPGPPPGRRRGRPLREKGERATRLSSPHAKRRPDDWNPAMETPAPDQPSEEFFDGGPSSRSIPMLLPLFILFFILLFFLSVFLLRDLVHYASGWLSRSGADGSEGGAGAAGGRQTRGEAEGGLDPAIIASFPKMPYSAVRGMQEGKCGAECAVCLAEFAGGDVIRLLTVCCHAFHPLCIDSWLAFHTTCPICRSDLQAPPDEAAVQAVREAVGGVAMRST